MRPPLRLGLGALGVGLAVYGAAWLTGGWLGTPPWVVVSLGEGWSDPEFSYVAYDRPRVVESRRGEADVWAGSVALVGLALTVSMAWPRASGARAA